jgi:hypothetical protein
MGTANGLALVDLICANPLVTTRLVDERLRVSRPTVLRLLRGLELLLRSTRPLPLYAQASRGE